MVSTTTWARRFLAVAAVLVLLCLAARYAFLPGAEAPKDDDTLPRGTDTPLPSLVNLPTPAPRAPLPVCVSNGNGANPRVASLWLRGTPERYGSRHRFYWNNESEGGCMRGGSVTQFVSLALVNTLMARWAHEHPTWPSVRGLCKGGELCISTGDEMCQFPLDWPQQRHVIMRQYYSSKYPYPGLALGPRYEFEWVPFPERLRGRRHYAFNFLGSINRLKPDRMQMRKVVEGHDWKARGVRIKWFVYQDSLNISDNARE
jgi:hypothetical protein